MHGVLYCRVILNLRATAERDKMCPSRVSDVRFWDSPMMLQASYELDEIHEEPSVSTTSPDPTHCESVLGLSV